MSYNPNDFEQAITLIENMSVRSDYYLNFGKIIASQNLGTYSRKYHEKSLEISKMLNSRKNIAADYLNIAISYLAEIPPEVLK